MWEAVQEEEERGMLWVTEQILESVFKTVTVGESRRQER